jgi:hypothetical protein
MPRICLAYASYLKEARHLRSIYGATVRRPYLKMFLSVYQRLICPLAGGLKVRKSLEGDSQGERTEIQRVHVERTIDYQLEIFFPSDSATSADRFSSMGARKGREPNVDL